jgi:hypothetical protein
MKNTLPYIVFVVLSLMTGFVGGRLGMAQNPAAPTWMSSVNSGWVSVANSADYSQPAKKYQIGIFRDDSNGNLVYVSETGSIAVVHPAKLPAPVPGQNPAATSSSAK